MVRGSYAHERARATFERGCARQTGDAARDRRPTSPTPSGCCSRSCDEPARRVPALAEGDAGARGGAPPRVRPAALPAPRGAARRRFEPEHLELPFGDDGGPPVELERRPAGARTRSTASTRSDGTALVRDYKSGKRVDSLPGRPVGAREPPPGGALHARGERAAAGCEPAGGVYVPLGEQRPRPRGLVRDEGAEELGERLHAHRLPAARGVRAKLDWALGRRCARSSRGCAAASSAVPRPVRLERRLLVPVDLQVRVVTPC